MSDLKPCPHCGESRAFVEDIDTTQGLKWYVFCYACGATGGYKATPSKAIEAWNTRADDNEEVVTCFNCGAQIDMLGMFTPLAKSSVLYRHYATYCPACGERLVDA